jgi:hypothetical protein
MARGEEVYVPPNRDTKKGVGNILRISRVSWRPWMVVWREPYSVG